MRETQHDRTRLSWTRTCLSVAAVAVAEVRLCLRADHPVAVVALLLAGFTLVALIAAAAHRRLGLDVTAIARHRMRADGTAAAVVAGCAVLAGLLGTALVLGA
ncbi:hypothetical protein JCM18899A_05550 [Nocardioides sp. AN3]